MLARLFLFFTITTAVELFLLLKFASLVGVGWTLALILVTGFLGAWLTRREGMRALRSLRRDLVERRMPTGSIIDGICVLIAGALLVTPGVLTDIVGFLLLFPPARLPLKALVVARVTQAVRSNVMRGGVTIVAADASGVHVVSREIGSPPTEVHSDRRPIAGARDSDDVIDV